ARQRAASEGVEVQWVRGDVAELDRLGLEPGYDLLYDIGCIHGLSDSGRRGAAAGLTQLAAPGATLLIGAFTANRHLLLPGGMNEEAGAPFTRDDWKSEESRSTATVLGHREDAPAFVRRANPTVYRLTRQARSSAMPADPDS